MWQGLMRIEAGRALARSNKTNTSTEHSSSAAGDSCLDQCEIVLSDSEEREHSDKPEKMMNDQVPVGGQEYQLEPGFRFYPTDEEIVIHYLQKKIDDQGFTCRAVTEIDLHASEPWQLSDMASMGEQEWYFFTKHVPKYSTGMRSNRSTQEGYWKSTGRDREVHSKGVLIGMKKTLVFYVGRAPGGKKTDWIMHEYRLHDSDVKDWVVCRVFDKSSAKVQSPEHIAARRSAEFSSSSTTTLTETYSQDGKRPRTEVVSKASSIIGNYSFMPNYVKSTVGSHGMNHNSNYKNNSSWAAGPKRDTTPVANPTPASTSSDSNLQFGGLSETAVHPDGKKFYNQPQVNFTVTPLQHPYQGQYQLGNPPANHLFRADPRYMLNQQPPRTSSVPNIRTNPDSILMRAPLSPSVHLDPSFMQLPREYNGTDFSNSFFQNWRPSQQ